MTRSLFERLCNLGLPKLGECERDLQVALKACQEIVLPVAEEKMMEEATQNAIV